MTSEEYCEYGDDEDLYLEFLNYIITLKEQNEPIEISVIGIIRSNHKLKNLIFNNKKKLIIEKWNKLTNVMRNMRKKWLNMFDRVYKNSNEDRVKVFQDTMEKLRHNEIYHLQYFSELNIYKEPSYAEFKIKQSKKYIANLHEKEVIIKESIRGAMKPEEIISGLTLEIEQSSSNQLLLESFEEEQSDEKNLKEISFIKEKISRLEAEGRNHNTKILERLEDRLKTITSNTESEQNLKPESKGTGIFNKKTTDGIKKFNKIEDLDVLMKEIPEIKNDESTSFINYELNSETKNVQTSEEPIEKWGESAYEENELNKIKSKEEVVETPKVEVVETPKVDVLVENLEEIPKENIKKIRRIIRRIIIPKEEASENVELKKDETKEEFT